MGRALAILSLGSRDQALPLLEPVCPRIPSSPSPASLGLIYSSSSEAGAEEETGSPSPHPPYRAVCIVPKLALAFPSLPSAIAWPFSQLGVHHAPPPFSGCLCRCRRGGSAEEF